MEKARLAPAVGQFEALGYGMVLLGAFASFVLSVSLWFTGSHDQGVFVGLWVPSILTLGALTAGRVR
jgi:hypothetical protein